MGTKARLTDQLPTGSPRCTETLQHIEPVCICIYASGRSRRSFIPEADSLLASDFTQIHFKEQQICKMS